MIIMIAAIAQNNGLGKDNQLVWHLPDDFKRFKQLTSGHPIIMGRKTFESLPGRLPNRQHIVITRATEFAADGCLVAHSIEEALQLVPKTKDAYIIGGGEIYKLAMPFADKLEVTRVNTTVEADAFFPEIEMSDWKIVQTEFHPTDEKHAFSFTYETLVRK